MTRWDTPIQLLVHANAGSMPAYLRVAETIVAEIRRGRLAPGGRIPSSRRLAKSLGLHRNTILAGYNELLAQGWIETVPAGGTFVCQDIPTLQPPASSVPATDDCAPAYPFSGARLSQTRLAAPYNLSARPDGRLVPLDALARAYRRALRRHGAELIGYGDPIGHSALRRELRTMLTSSRGLHLGEGEILITQGSQMALYLTAHTLLRAGDRVAVESLGYRPAWSAFRSAGAVLVPIDVDEHGMRIDYLRRCIHGDKLRAVYVTPHHQYPTTATLSAGRRLELLQLAATHGLAIIEDDYDHDFHYHGQPVLPLAATAEQRSVIYIGTLSKVFAPGLRLGYVVAPAAVIEAMASYRRCVDDHGDQVLQAAIAELLEDGEIQRHVRRVRRIYATRREVMVHELRRGLGGTIRFRVPQGGMAIWTTVDPSVDICAWQRRALAQGVYFAPPSEFSFDGQSRPHTRFGFAALAEEEIPLAVNLLRRTL